MQHHPRNLDPFRLLVYLEWLILAIVMVIDVLIPTPFLRLSRVPWLMVVSTVAFAVTGLQRFQKTQTLKVAMLLIALGLVNIATFWGGSRLFALLYLVLVIRIWLSFRTWQSLIATGMILLLFGLTLSWISEGSNKINYANLPILAKHWGTSLIHVFVLLFTLSTLLAASLTQAVVLERRSREQLAIANEQLRRYALRIEDQATLQERNRIARDIHDSLGHALTGLNLQLETALKLWSADPTTAKAFLTDAKKLSSTALKEVRESVSIMRTNPLQSQSLGTALQGLIHDFQRSTGIQPTCNLQLPTGLGTDLQVAIYRIVQEALTNICKYSHATEVGVEITTSLPYPPQIQVSIRDNGDGFDVGQNTTGFGLQGMRERASALNGTFKILSQPGSGCKIQATFPLPYSIH